MTCGQVLIGLAGQPTCAKRESGLGTCPLAFLPPLCGVSQCSTQPRDEYSIQPRDEYSIQPRDEYSIQSRDEMKEVCINKIVRKTF